LYIVITVGKMASYAEWGL